MAGFHERRDVLAWGRAHHFAHHVARPAFADELPALLRGRCGRAVLARGLGRSYGDSGLNADNILIDMRGLDHVRAFDAEKGILEAEAGMSLKDILVLCAQQGGKWFPPVSPGTKFVTLGGAIANDVHGKNHHGAGCFGNHVLSLALMRSDGSLHNCTAQENADLFRATIGGMGLTGLILSARIALKPVPGPWLESEDIRYDSLEEFYDLTAQSLNDWEYTVAWIDCLAEGPSLGRGIFSRSRHIAAARPALPVEGPRLALPINFPNFALNRMTLAAFNALNIRRASRRPARKLVPFEKVFYPLDSIGAFNRLYGSRGFYQYQCVVPPAQERDAMRALLTEISRAGAGSFLAVLKTFGNVPSPGLMSFPMPGTTLALDFANEGSPTIALLSRLDAITRTAGGRIYAAKDGRVSAADFQAGYPQWRDFARLVDPGFSSTFWRRVTQGAAA
ncbi:MAG: FAD-dependent oxidoreductase [Rhodospirillaceae bacterium]